jgi:hypothetical protein
MKDILIKGAKVKKELLFWLASFLAAAVINIYAIIKYNTNWVELLSQLHIVILLSLLIYFILLGIRGVVYLLKPLLRNSKS